MRSVCRRKHEITMMRYRETVGAIRRTTAAQVVAIVRATAVAIPTELSVIRIAGSTRLSESPPSTVKPLQ
jgi:hypothetical protein